jgi:hypothetical protein
MTNTEIGELGVGVGAGTAGLGAGALRWHRKRQEGKLARATAHVARLFPNQKTHARELKHLLRKKIK